MYIYRFIATNLPSTKKNQKKSKILFLSLYHEFHNELKATHDSVSIYSIIFVSAVTKVRKLPIKRNNYWIDQVFMQINYFVLTLKFCKIKSDLQPKKLANYTVRICSHKFNMELIWILRENFHINQAYTWNSGEKFQMNFTRTKFILEIQVKYFIWISHKSSLFFKWKISWNKFMLNSYNMLIQRNKIWLSETCLTMQMASTLHVPFLRMT